MDSLAILSGKGGSGKTTLSILLTQLLASCNKRTILVDCDLSTNGATFFFEKQLLEKEKYCTFSGIISGECDFNERNMEILNVTSYIDFIPSCVFFPSNIIKNGVTAENNFEVFLKYLNENYDIVIFDCQAGYSFVTDIITKYTEKNLAVIEADAVSASSLRVLYTQMSKQLDNSSTYQIFNKINIEEKEIYSKLTYETLFTSLSPILFDWNIRKSFVTNDLPNIDYTDFDFANDICTLAIVLFPQCKKNIFKFVIDFKEKKATKLNDKIEYMHRSIKKMSRRMLFFVIVLLLTLIFSILGIIISDVFKLSDFFKNPYVFWPIVFVFIGIIIFTLYKKEESSGKKFNELLKNWSELMDEYDNLSEEISRLKEKNN